MSMIAIIIEWLNKLLSSLSGINKKLYGEPPEEVSIPPEEPPPPLLAPTKQPHPFYLSSLKVITGELRIEERPWFCLKAVRQIVEDAMGWPSHHFYTLYWTHRVEENTTTEPWARDLERSLRMQGFKVDGPPKQGDLVFNYNAAAPYGHVGLMLTDELVIENYPGTRGFKGPGAIQITALSDWAKPTTVIRLIDGA